MRRAWLAMLAAGTLSTGAIRADGPVWVKPSGRVSPVWQPSTAPQPPNDLPKPPSKPLTIPKITPPPEPAPPPKPVVPPVETPKSLPMPRPAPAPDTEPTNPPTPKDIDPPTPPASPATPDPIPPPPPVTPQPEGCLEPPPVGAFQPGVLLPARRGVVGSPNLSLSRDSSVLDLFGAGMFTDEAGTAVVGESSLVDRAFVSAEYLLWWARPMGVPALATTAAGQSVGFLGTPGTQTLLGPGNFGSTSRNGFRVRAGVWLEDAPIGGLDAGYFFLGTQTTTVAVDSDRFPTLARPFFAANFNQEFAELVAFPNLASGRLVAETSSYLWGADVNARCCLYRVCEARAELFAGFRYLHLGESLGITEFVTATGPLASPEPVGTSAVVTDSFRTRNNFYGGQVGWAAARQAGRFELSARASVALGATHQQLDITGSQLRVRPGQPPEAFTGGLLAVGPNLGRFTQTKFSVVPEATLNVGLWLTPALKAFVGYNFLYWTNTLRPGDQIDRVVDISFVPNFGTAGFAANRPRPTMQQTDLWAQGVQFGVEWRW